jgi:regulator of protease activity HflC (stomatin/prohibitin superfamily)
MLSDAMIWGVGIGLAILVLGAAIKRRFRVTTIRDWEQGILWRNGRFQRLLGAGRYRSFRSGTEIDVIDLRERLFDVNGQESPTRDEVPVKLSLALTWKVLDPLKAVQTSQAYDRTIWVAAQLAVRRVLAERDLSEVLGARKATDEAIESELREALDGSGLEPVRVAIKDLMVSGDIKRALADAVKARAEGRARLERARAESAALRSLANAARMIRDNGGLYELRLLETLQVAAQSEKNTLMLGIGDKMRFSDGVNAGGDGGSGATE